MNLPDSPAQAHPEDPSGLYHSYLIRLWRSHPRAPLRASAQCIQTGVITRFASLESLFAFLQTQGAAPASTGEKVVK